MKIVQAVEKMIRGNTYEATPMLQDRLPQTHHEIKFLTAVMDLVVSPQKVQFCNEKRFVKDAD